MNALSVHNGLALPENDTCRKINGHESLDYKKRELRKVTKEFESYFVLHMLKAMRKTIPKSELTSGGLGEDMYTSMFDEELSRKVSGTSANSLADLLYRSLERSIENEYRGDGQTGHDTKIESLNNLNNQRKFKIENGDISPPQASELKEESITETRGDNSGNIWPINDSLVENYGSIVESAALKYNVNPQLIYSVIRAESGGKADAVSPKGAKGLMQLIDSTATDMGVSDSLDPEQNIMGGTKYLRQMLDKFDDDLTLALAAYNSGPGNVSKYNGVPPFRETKEYVAKVLESFQTGKKS